MINAKNVADILALKTSKHNSPFGSIDRILHEVVDNALNFGVGTTVWNRSHVEIHQEKLEYLGFKVRYTDNNEWFAEISIKEL